MTATLNGKVPVTLWLDPSHHYTFIDRNTNEMYKATPASLPASGIQGLNTELMGRVSFEFLDYLQDEIAVYCGLNEPETPSAIKPKKKAKRTGNIRRNKVKRRYYDRRDDEERRSDDG